ncbi:hypothetical protein ABT214_00355 [Micromonospora purpureochromogenes]
MTTAAAGVDGSGYLGGMSDADGDDHPLGWPLPPAPPRPSARTT